MGRGQKKVERILFPDLAKRHCPYFTACGRLKKAVKWSDANRKLAIGKYRKGGKQFFFRLLRTDGKHIHFDLAHESLFRDKPPKASLTITAATDLVSKAYNKKALLRIEGAFLLSLDEIEETSFYKAYMKPRGEIGDNLSVGVTAIELYFSNAPYARIEWRELADATYSAVVSMHPVDLKIGPEYLCRAFENLTSCQESIFGRESK